MQQQIGASEKRGGSNSKHDREARESVGMGPGSGKSKNKRVRVGTKVGRGGERRVKCRTMNFMDVEKYLSHPC